MSQICLNVISDLNISSFYLSRLFFVLIFTVLKKNSVISWFKFVKSQILNAVSDFCMLLHVVYNEGFQHLLDCSLLLSLTFIQCRDSCYCEGPRGDLQLFTLLLHYYFTAGWFTCSLKGPNQEGLN